MSRREDRRAAICVECEPGSFNFVEAAPTSRDEFEQFIRVETARWARVIKAALNHSSMTCVGSGGAGRSVSIADA